ncbi:MAG: TRAP transporter substrate-binding protein [Boseongicola sp. SB0667_bin_21]|nr:TRAP transporter substrate-binding protein [Boseongicola sp. SB0667_bin_21]
MRVGRGLSGAVALVLFAAGLLCSSPDRAEAEQIILRLHHFNSPKAIAHRLFLQPWADEIEEKSEGLVKIQVFPAMQLGGRPADLYGQARDGVVDIVWTIPGYTPGRFPLTEVFELPFLSGNATAASQALTEFHGKWLREEYKDTHPLVFHSTAPTHVHTVGKQISVLEDFEGMKIRAPSRISAETLRVLGAVPVGMPVPAVYEALSRGVVEGTAIPWTIMRPFRLHEVTKFHTEASLSRVLFVMTMNKRRYDELPPDVKAIIDDSTGMALAERLGRMWDDDEKPGRAIAVERGHPILSLSEAERQRWREKTRTVVDGWVEKVGALGHDGQAMLADAARLLAKYGGGQQ